MTNQPFLTLVCSVRTTTESGDSNFYWDALSFNHEELAARSVAHEILLIELTDDTAGAVPVEGRPRLAPRVGDGVLTRFGIDPRYDGAMPMCTSRSGGPFILNNVGIRRARGAFVLCLGAGLCLGRRVLDRIGSARIEAGAVYRAPRVDVSVEAWHDDDGWDMFEEPRRVIGHAGLADPAEFILLDRASFHELRGFTELYTLNRLPTGQELVTRAQAIGLPILSLGAPVYLAHHLSASGLVRRDFGRRTGAHLPGGLSHVAYLNPDIWGLAAAPERLLAPQRIWLDFDWSAVARLVDFSRVVPTTKA